MEATTEVTTTKKRTARLRRAAEGAPHQLIDGEFVMSRFFKLRTLLQGKSKVFSGHKESPARKAQDPVASQLLLQLLQCVLARSLPTVAFPGSLKRHALTFFSLPDNEARLPIKRENTCALASFPLANEQNFILRNMLQN
jgi:hypothetical protein